MYAKSGWPRQGRQGKKNVLHICTYVIRIHVQSKKYNIEIYTG